MKTLLCFALLTSVASAQGFGYAYELHDTEIGVPDFDGKLEMSAHRIMLLDTGGVLAAALGTMGKSEYLGSTSDGRTRTDYWLVEPVAPRPGGMGRLEIAWDGDASLTDAPDANEPSYFELRLVLGGGGLITDNLYYSVDVLDFTWRSLTGSTGSRSYGNDQIALYIGGELGVLFAPLFVGGFANYDWLGGLQKAIALGDDDVEDHTYDYGLVGGLAGGPLRLEVRWTQYQWSDISGDLRKRTMEGEQWTFGFTFVN